MCTDIDIRNRVEYFSQLTNCTVIEGSLQIVLIENAAKSQFESISFPHLREITGYLLIYRVYALRTLSHMFPNLAVIRGQTLFHNYAIVVFENPDLEDLGLRNLKRVVRGAVRIEHNAHLCYIDTIDWSRIMRSDVGIEHHFIRENGDPNQCSNVCPSVNGSSANSDICPVMDVSQEDGYQAVRRLCWNQDYCQIGRPTTIYSFQYDYLPHN